MLKKQTLFGINITAESERDVLEYILHSVKDQEDRYYIVTPNPEIMTYAARHESYRSKLKQARIAICDGVGLYLALKALGRPVPGRIAGVDLLESLCKSSVNLRKESVRKPVTIGFLGGRGSVAVNTAKCLMQKYPGLEVVFAAPEWGPEGYVNAGRMQDLGFTIQDNKSVNHESNIMNQQHIDILFVAYGFPKQELWMAEHSGKVPVTVMMGVGGAFDYISGNVSRAPAVVRSLGLEWFYRLVRQPWRWRRQLALLSFIYLVIKERVTT